MEEARQSALYQDPGFPLPTRASRGWGRHGSGPGMPPLRMPACSESRALLLPGASQAHAGSGPPASTRQQSQIVKSPGHYCPAQTFQGKTTRATENPEAGEQAQLLPSTSENPEGQAPASSLRQRRFAHAPPDPHRDFRLTGQCTLNVHCAPTSQEKKTHICVCV